MDAQIVKEWCKVPTGTTGLERKACLVTLTVTGWSGVKSDHAVANDVAARAGGSPVAADVGKYTKRLIVGDALSELHRVASIMRGQHYMLTMPWDDRSARLLPASLYDRYVQEIDAIIGLQKQAKKQFRACYAGYVEDAAQRLGSLFDAEEYPSIEELDDKIRAAYVFAPLPKAEHFAVDGIGEEQIERIRRSIVEQTEQKLQGTVTTLWSRLADAVATFTGHMEPNDEGDVKAIKASHLLKLREVVALIPDLNVAADPALNEVVRDVLAMLNGVEAGELNPESAEFDSEKREHMQSELSDLDLLLTGCFFGSSARGSANEEGAGNE